MANMIDLAVYEDGEYSKEAFNRPRRITPSGYTGVNVGGRVYAVRNSVDVGLHIDLADESWTTSQCPTIGTGVSNNWKEEESDGFYYIETNRFGHYMVFDGVKDFFESICNKLEVDGLNIIGQGASHRPADDGVHYDWYIRISKDIEQDQLYELIEKSLSTLVLDQSDDVPQDELTFLGDEVSLNQSLDWQEINEVLEQKETRLSQAHEEIRELATRLNSVVHESAAKLETLTRELVGSERNRKVIEAILEAGANEEADYGRLIDQQSIDHSVEMKNLDDLYGEERQSHIDEKSRLISHIDVLSRERNEAVDQVRILGQKLRSTPIDGNSNSKIRERNYYLMTQALGRFDRLDFESDAAEILLNDFVNLDDIFGVFSVLQKGELPRFTSLRGGRVGAYEVTDHIATGRPEVATLGRVYFKTGGEKLLICFHVKRDKQEQDRVIKQFLKRCESI